MLQWMDDFSSYGLGADTAARQTSTLRMLNGLYAEIGGASKAILWPDPDPSAGGAPVLRVGANVTASDARVRKVLSGPREVVGVAARYWLDNLPASSLGYNVFTAFLTTGAATLCELREDPSGYLEVYNGSGVLIARSDAPVIISNAWRHIETKVTFDAVNGEVEVRLEGVQVIHEVDVNTMGAQVNLCQNVCFNGRSPGNGNMYVKDFIIWDGTGALNNDFLGSCQVYKIVPDADVALPWAPSTGATGYNLINESTPSDDVGYISADATPPAASVFGLTDLPVDVTSVKGVMSMHRSRKTDGGDGNIMVSLTDGVNTEDGADRAITTAWTYWADMFEVAPDGLNWSKAKVNALELAIDRTV